jgi:Spy/CpxP family protein refolding chaperone
MGGRLIQLLLALSLLLNTFVLAGFVYRSWIAPPFERHRGPPPPGGGPLEFMARDLDLNGSQRKALHDVFERNEADRRRRIHDIQQAREEMGAELRKSQVDWAKIDALIDQVARMRGEAQKENLRAILDLEPQLTQQQRDKLHTVLADRYINPPRWGGPRPPEPGRARDHDRGPGPGRPPQQ